MCAKEAVEHGDRLSLTSGLGQRSKSNSSSSRSDKAALPGNARCGLDVPVEQLPTKQEIRQAIPRHCFEHHLPTALSLLLRDIVIVFCFGYAANATLRTEGMRLIDWIGWGFYAFWQGSAFTGLWVLAHECGHGGFSASKRINDSVGFVLHSSLLVPYFSWQFSHAKHHAKTNNLVDGESHNPDTADDLSYLLGINYYKLYDLLGDDGFAAFQLFAHLVVGWPIYLLTNATGGRRAFGGKPVTGIMDHFRPSSGLFPRQWSRRIAASTAGVLLAITCLAQLGRIFGAARIFFLYVPAYLVCNGWLVLYTWLQHTHEDLAHYGDDEWSWVKGALSTIDRPYSECFGFHDWMHHRIGSTHVFHHVFSAAPCYKAVEATRHLKAFLEPRGLYNYDKRPILQAAWETAKRCHGVDGIEGSQYLKHISELKPKNS